MNQKTKTTPNICTYYKHHHQAGRQAFSISATLKRSMPSIFSLLQQPAKQADNQSGLSIYNNNSSSKQQESLWKWFYVRHDSWYQIGQCQGRWISRKYKNKQKHRRSVSTFIQCIHYIYIYVYLALAISPLFLYHWSSIYKYIYCIDGWLLHSLYIDDRYMQTKCYIYKYILYRLLSSPFKSWSWFVYIQWTKTMYNIYQVFVYT